ncbi:hypothetical protein ACTXG6_34545 [Pseudonocardia sp. Cha107L01]|uniref:hypothetical protein n=1 Tax=Pseudonocardia sp. Cha107L01 TaxID=3457576 RepID=UPI00403E81BA
MSGLVTVDGYNVQDIPHASTPAPPERAASGRSPRLRAARGERPHGGLIRKARALAELWPDPGEARTLLDDVQWLAARRNSFAHRLLDEGGP